MSGFRSYAPCVLVILFAGCGLRTNAKSTADQSEDQRICVRGCQEAHSRCSSVGWSGGNGNVDWQTFLAELGLRAMFFASPCANQLTECYSTCDDGPKLPES